MEDFPAGRKFPYQNMETNQFIPQPIVKQIFIHPFFLQFSWQINKNSIIANTDNSKQGISILFYANVHKHN